jgi:predicted nucleic acid-binding protein
MIGDSTFFVTLHRERQRQKRGPAHALLEAHAEEKFMMSVITRGEMARGFADRGAWEAFCRVFITCEINDEVLWKALEIYRHLRERGIPTGENDLWIAATALATDQTLVTNNTKNFSNIPQLRLRSH